MGGLDIRLLGPPLLSSGGAALTFDTRKAVAVLARLAVEGPQRRETLATLLWPDSERDRARGALRRTLSVLRSAVDDPALSIGRDEIRLEPGSYVCDVLTSRDLLARARAHHGRGAAPCPECVGWLTEAVALHRGDFLAGFGLRDSPEFDDWQYVQGEGLRGELAAALDLLINALVHRGALEEADPFLRRRLALDPLHEPTHRRMMLLHAWAGRREDAVRQYRDCVATLERELGVPPLEETAELYQAILAGRPPSPPAALRSGATPAVAGLGAVMPPAGAARDRPGLVGRQDELARLLAVHRAAGSEGQLVVLEGEAGVGKTRLLQEVAAQVRQVGASAVVVRCYPGEETLAYGPVAEALRVVAGGAPPPVAGSWLSEVARLVPELLERDGTLPAPAPLGTREADRRFFEGVHRTLAAAGSADRPALLVIEDLQWADAASQDLITYLAHRLHRSSLCLVLSWRSEEVGRDHPLRRLTVPQRDAGAVTHLLLDRLDRAEVAELARSAGVEEEHLDAGRLFRETEGLPLVVVEYLAAFRDGHLDGPTWRVPPGARDLLAQRLVGLSETARQVLTAAAVIGRSFDLETLLHASGRSDDEVVDGLEELLAADVVTEMEPAAGTGTSYDFRHNALRAVAYDEASIARRRLLHARVAASLRRRGRSSDAPVPLPVVAEHLRLAGEVQEAARTFARAGDESRSLAAHAEAVEHYRTALALGHPGVSRLHEAIGDLLTLLGDYRGALDSYQSAAAQGADPQDLARYEQRIAGVHERRGDWSAAEAHLEAALAALPDAETAQRARLESELSLTAHRRGSHGEARRRAEASLRLAEDSGDARATAQAHNILGILARAEGEVDVAVAHLRQSVDAAGSVGDLAATVAALNNLALACADQGDVPAALELAKTALARCRTEGDRHREAAILNNLADLLRAAGQEDEAMGHLKQAVAIFAEIGETDGYEPEIWKLVEW